MDITNIIEQTYQDHILDKNILPSVAFRITQKSGGSAYSQIVSWVPGCISLFGDTGNLQFQDYYAFADFHQSMGLIADSNIDYLRSKLTSDYKDSKICRKKRSGPQEWGDEFLWRIKGLKKAAEIILKQTNPYLENV